MPRPVAAVGLAALFLLGFALLPLAAESLPSADDRIARGRKIFLEGSSLSGSAITAVMSEASVEVPATAVPCGSCHGRDGRGGKEGGVAPSDLTWRALSRPYAVTSASGRKHPAYDERSLTKAIAMGIDAGGNPLHVAMPRFRLSRQDMGDLLSYMRQLGEGGGEADPGVTATSIRLGLLIPREGPLAPMGRAVEAVLRARFDEVNERGGLYGRTLELRTGELVGSAEQQRNWSRDFLQREEVFASVGSFLFGPPAEAKTEESLATLFEERQVPLIGPFSLDPHESFPLNRYVFYLSPGPAEQARALLSYAHGQPWGARPKAWAVLQGAELEGGAEGLGAAAAKEMSRSWSWPEGRTLTLPAAAASDATLAARDREALREAVEAGADPVLIVGSASEARRFLQAAEALAWHPHVLATATSGGGFLEASEAFAGKVTLALPALPGPIGEVATLSYRTLAGSHHLGTEDLSAQLSALGAAEVLIRALEKAGRNLSREALIAQLETLRRFETGFAPPQTFGPNQRLGARGAYVFPLDLTRGRLGAEGGWIEAER